MRLKTASTTFKTPRYTKAPPSEPCAARRSGTSGKLAPKRRAIPKKIGARTRFTKGPAMAIFTSSAGFSGRLFMRARPPIGRRVMSCISIPSRWATRECPYSCNKTQKNRATMSPIMMSAPNRLPVFCKPT
jgi:hypothetical protein